MQRLEVFHARCLRKMLRVKYLEHRTNRDIRTCCKIPCMFAYIRYHRLRWLGCLCRMSNTRYPKQVAFGACTSNYNNRVQRRWDVSIQADLDVLNRYAGIADFQNSWSSLAMDAFGWKDIIRKQLYHNDNFVTPPEERRSTSVSGENRPFPCTLCPKSFYHDRDLNIHIAKIHNVRDNRWLRRDLTNQFSIQFVLSRDCPVCFKTFKNVAGCRTHWSRIHFDNVVCLACKKMFASSNEKDEHICPP